MTTKTFTLPHWFESNLLSGIKRGIEKEGRGKTMVGKMIFRPCQCEQIIVM